MRPFPRWTPLLFLLLGVVLFPLLFMVPRDSERVDAFLEALPFVVGGLGLCLLPLCRPGRLRTGAGIALAVFVVAPIWWPLALTGLYVIGSPTETQSMDLLVLPERDGPYRILLPLPAGGLPVLSEIRPGRHGLESPTNPGSRPYGWRRTSHSWRPTRSNRRTRGARSSGRSRFAPRCARAIRLSSSTLRSGPAIRSVGDKPASWANLVPRGPGSSEPTTTACACRHLGGSHDGSPGPRDLPPRTASGGPLLNPIPPRRPGIRRRF